MSAISVNSKQSADEQLDSMYLERDRRWDHAKRRREKYANKRMKMQLKKRKHEMQADVNEKFKVEVMRPSLQTAQQNAGIFHSFTTSFCAMTN